MSVSGFSEVAAIHTHRVYAIDLATHCRLALYDHPKYPRLVRYVVLYPLYVLCEIAIVCTDLAELLGSAVGLCLLIPSMPLWAAVLLTAADVLIFLLLGDPSRRKQPVRMFEFSIIALVSVPKASYNRELTLKRSTGIWRPSVFHRPSGESSPRLAIRLLGIHSLKEAIRHRCGRTLHR